jgi:hypothetical protein
MKAILRRLMGYPAKSIGQKVALEIAQAECTKNGWTWNEPVSVHERIKKIVVYTNNRDRGNNVVVVLNAFDGNVIAARLIRF